MSSISVSRVSTAAAQWKRITADKAAPSNDLDTVATVSAVKAGQTGRNSPVS